MPATLSPNGYFRLPRVLSTLLMVGSFSAQAVLAESVVKNEDRIVFVGDSITGQGAGAGAGGWMALIGQGLRLEHPASNQTLIGLGGSGSTVGAWLNHEKNSREKAVVLDVKGVEVGRTLDAGAEILVVMLGMNDALSPSLRNTPADFDLWEQKYAELIAVLTARAKPRIVALATVTPCTEEATSPKNQVIAELNDRLKKLANEKGCRLLPTGDTARELLALGRSYNPEFHIAGDMVHPSAAGHTAIAVGMLRGLAEEGAAEKLLKIKESQFKPATAKLPSLSYTVTRTDRTSGKAEPDFKQGSFSIRYFWNSASSQAEPSIKVSVPEGWKAEPDGMNGATGEITATGPLDRIENKIHLTAIAGDERAEQTISIPAGWRIATGAFSQAPGWKHGGYSLESDQSTPLDEKLAGGKGLDGPVEFSPKSTGHWGPYVANRFNFTGRTAGSIDLAGVVFSNFGTSAYAARWIRSGRDRAVKVDMGSSAFANPNSMAVWINGASVYKGPITSAKKDSPFAAKLIKGWNLVLVKSNYYQWQWQLHVDISGEDGDDLSDLRYAMTPPSE